MITLKFGLPGCGKTTMLVRDAIQALKKYDHVYTNVHIAVEGITYIDNHTLGMYDFGENSILLLDEASSIADSRMYMKMSQALIDYLNMHRHYKHDIIFYNQGWDTLDRKIRLITNKVWYLHSEGIWKKLGITWYYPVPYGILIPEKGDSESSKYGEIIQGYYKPPLIVRLINGGCMIQKPFYKYFDSWERKPLKPLPEIYKPYRKEEQKTCLVC